MSWTYNKVSEKSSLYEQVLKPNTMIFTPEEVPAKQKTETDYFSYKICLGPQVFVRTYKEHIGQKIQIPIHF